MRYPLFFILILLSVQTWALPPYYGDLQWTDSSDLKLKLFGVLDSPHLPQSGHVDNIVQSCMEKLCYKHSPVGYKKARQHLFGDLFLTGHSPETYSIKSSYCQSSVTNHDLSPTDPLAPMEIPDIQVLNAEHTWPQSKFSKKFPKDLQKSDLHILLPEYENVNSQRSNHPFGEVKKVTSSLCSGSALGKSKENMTVFEPHDRIKGNVARALFYFSIRYNMPLDPQQEAYLKSWHQNDPPDQEEIDRHEKIFSIQKNRNPFVDDPTLVNEIFDF